MEGRGCWGIYININNVLTHLALGLGVSPMDVCLFT